MSKHIFFLFLILFVFANCTNSPKEDKILPITDPEAAGMSAMKLSHIDSLVNEYVVDNKFPGGVFLVARRGKIVYYKNLGNRSLETGEPYQKNDIFRIASMTKAVTTVAIMQLYEGGKLSLDDPVARYIPAFETPLVVKEFNEEDSTYTVIPANNKITIRHLLTHTSGIGNSKSKVSNVSAIYSKNYANISSLSTDPPSWDTEQLVNNLAEMPLAFHPGEQYLYGYSMDVLGRVIEVISKLSLAEYFEHYIFKPLGMEDTHFYPPKEKLDRLVPVHDYHNRKMIMYQKDDPLSTFIKNPEYKLPKYYRGGGGLTSTTMDYAKFLQSLLYTSNSYDDSIKDYRILGRKTIELMTSDQFEKLNKEGKGRNDKIGLSHCLGFALTTATAIDSRSPGTYEWGGSLSTKFIIDPKEELIFVGMSQTIPVYHQELYGKMIAIIYGAIDD